MRQTNLPGCVGQAKITVRQVFLKKQLPDQASGYFYRCINRGSAAMLMQVVFCCRASKSSNHLPNRASKCNRVGSHSGNEKTNRECGGSIDYIGFNFIVTDMYNIKKRQSISYGSVRKQTEGNSRSDH